MAGRSSAAAKRVAILLEMNQTRAERKQQALWIGVGFALAVLLYILSPILAPFAVGAVLAYICDPAVNWLVARRLPRAAAVLLVVVLLHLVLLVLVLALVPTFYREAAQLFGRLPDLVELANTRLAPWLGQQFGFEVNLDADSLRKWLTTNWNAAEDLLPLLISKAKIGGLAILGFLGTLFLIPVVMFYLLPEWPRILQVLEDTIPRPWLAHTVRLLGEVDRVLSEFLRGQLSVMLILALFYSIGLWIAGLQFALPVGLVTGLLIFIPYVGFGAGLLLAVLAALLQGGWGPLVGVAVVYTVGQLIESFGLTPYLVGERIGLHPLAVIFALMAFGQLFGFVGIMIGLPASAALLVGVREVRGHYLASSFYRGRSAPERQP
jgi:predicted PurR-regulated permease PerM